MREKIHKALLKATLFLAVFSALPLSSCAKLPEKEYSPDEVVESIDDALHAVDTEIEEIPAEEMDWGEEAELKDNDNVDETSTIVYIDDIKLNKAENAFELLDSRYTNLPAPSANPSDILPSTEHLRLYDENGVDYPLRQISSTSGAGRFALPIEDMWRGHLYHLDLLQGDLCFQGKSPNVRSLSLIYEEYAPESSLTDEEGETPVAWPEDGLERRDIDIPNFSPAGVDHYEQDSLGLYFIYAYPMTDLAVNQLFRIGENLKFNDEWVDDEETFYGRFKSCKKNPNGAGYLIRYEKASALDIYNETYAAGSKEVDMSKGTIVADHDQLEEFVLTSEPLRKATYGLFQHYGVKPPQYRVNALDWFSHLKITFSTKYDGKAFVFKVTVKVTINPENHINIVLQGEFTSKTTYNISAAAKIKYKWGFLPVGASFNIKVLEDNLKTWSFGVMIDSSVNPFDKKEATDKITKDIEKANNETLPWKSLFDKNSSQGAKTVKKDGASWDLFSIDINYFVPITIRFKLAFYFEANLSFQAVLQYSSHTQRVDISYSTENNNERAVDAANESKEVQTGALSILFIGKLTLEGGISVSFGFGFFGLYKYLHAEVIVKAGGLLEIVGYMSLNWVWGEHDDGDFTFAVGGKIELSIVLKVSIDVFLISLGYNHTWPIGKWPLIGLANMDSIMNWASDYAPYESAEKPGDAVNIGDGTKLNDLGLLIFTVFSGNDFAVKTSGYKHDYTVKVFYGALVPDSWEVHVKAFTITLEGDYLELNNGVFTKTDSAPETPDGFDTIINIQVKDSLGQAPDRKFRLHYNYAVGELVKVSYTRQEGLRKEDAAPVKVESYHHRDSTYSFKLQENSPLGIVLSSYTVNVYNEYDVLIQTHTYVASRGTHDLELNVTGAVAYQITCNYVDSVIYPVYWLGFMGRVIYYKEFNGGEPVNLNADELADLYEGANNITGDVGVDESSSASSSESSSSSSAYGNYKFDGWENWPDKPVDGPLVIRAKYTKQSS